MKIMSSEMQGRLKHWMRTLKTDFYEPIAEIKWEMFTTMDELTLAEASQRTYTPVEPGFTWGHTWEYGWFRGRFKIPEHATGKTIVMDLKPGWEAAVFVNGEEFGTHRAEWVFEPHHYMVDNWLTLEAKAGETYEIYMEVYAGHYFPDAGGCNTGPVIPGSFQDPKVEGERVTLGKCTFGVWDEEAYQLYMDVDTLYKLFGTLDETSLRAAKVAEALEQFTLTVDFEQDKAARTADYIKAREVLRPAMEAKNGSSAPQFYGVGNSHLDLAWLWPMQETYRKTERTFAQQLRLLDRYPEYKFIQSQPASYEMCREHYPKLFARIQQSVKDGRWIADGSMWVEPDTNMAGGEALIRQLILGMRYYKEVFGVDCEVLWLPDTFGYTAALPQILKGCGVKYLVTQKIFWSYNDGERFPYHYFVWEGMDGSQVTSFLPTNYTYRTDPEELNKVWKNRSQERDLDAFLIPFGYGDGGGGPTRDHIEYALREKDLEGVPKFKMISPREFFREMEERTGGPKNKYVGELYFTAHRGTYTGQAMVKKNNRRNELLIREAEVWGTMAMMLGREYPYEKAEDIWKRILLHQFHDILPGSSIAKVYQDAEVQFGLIRNDAESMIQSGLGMISDMDPAATSVFNSLSFARSAVISLSDKYAQGAHTKDGINVPVVVTPEGVRGYVQVPSVGAVSIYPGKGDKYYADENFLVDVAYGETEDGYSMSNSRIAVRFNKRGEMTSYCLKSRSQEEIAAGPMNCFKMYKDVPRLFDAWDIDSNYIDQEVPGAYDVHCELTGSDLEAVLTVTGRIGQSTYTQRISLRNDSPMVKFETRVDWKELHRVLKVAFPVDVYAEEGINEIQFGYIKRPTHRSRAYDKDRFEVSNHRYSALCDNNHGAAVLNDCKYGISMNGNALELTLLTASASPEMRADNRVHEFTYAFTAWDGDFASADVVKRGWDINVPVRVLSGVSADFSMVNVISRSVILDAIKPAEDRSGDIILRFYDSKKAAGTTFVEGLPWKNFRAFECDMQENIKDELEVRGDGFTLEFKAFEIKTIRISKVD